MIGDFSVNICFILPRFSKHIYGGYKMVYEYANRMYIRGHNVSILFINKGVFQNYSLPRLLKCMGAYIETQVEPRWFELDKHIKKISGLNRNISKKVESIDVAIATSIDTVDYVFHMFPQALKVYYIQDFENWNRSKEEVVNSYKMGMKNIVISNWLESIVNQYSDRPCIVIKNPIDIDIYTSKIPIDKRAIHSISFLYHKGAHKGIKYLLQSINILKEKYPDLQVYAFGNAEKDQDLPYYVNYIKCANQLQTVNIYNSSTVFLCASINEGYGLTGLEAMACGTVLVSTSYGGVLEYANNGYNSLLSPIKDVESLVNNVCKVFDDEKLRTQLSQNGIETVKRGFNWDDAVNRFLETIGAN